MNSSFTKTFDELPLWHRLFLMAALAIANAWPAGILALFVFDMPPGMTMPGPLAGLANVRFWGILTVGIAMPWTALHILITELSFRIILPRPSVSVTIGALCGILAGWQNDAALSGQVTLKLLACTAIGALAGWIYWYLRVRVKPRRPR